MSSSILRFEIIAKGTCSLFRLWCVQPDPHFLSICFSLGPLVSFESLLSLYGEDVAIFNDMIVAVEDLRNVEFSLIMVRKREANEINFLILILIVTFVMKGGQANKAKRSTQDVNDIHARVKRWKTEHLGVPHFSFAKSHWISKQPERYAFKCFKY